MSMAQRAGLSIHPGMEHPDGCQRSAVVAPAQKDDRFWHKTDMPMQSPHICCRGQSGHDGAGRGLPVLDPNKTMDAWKEGGAPRCRAGLEYLTFSAVAGPPLLIWINAGTLVLGAKWFI